jgi:hypothetical protein
MAKRRESDGQIDWQMSFQAGEEQITLDSLPILEKDANKAQEPEKDHNAA